MLRSRPRLRALAATLLLCLGTLGAVLVDAERRRSTRRAQIEHAALVDTTRMPDLALSSSARWLRHPSLSEPGAATADLPSSLDVDPAGALIGPPTEILRSGAPSMAGPAR